MAKRAEEREKARREALHRPPEPQPKVPYVKYEIDFSKNEDDDEEEEETVLVEELMSASPEEISRAIAQLSNKDAISQIFELERAAKAAADEERRLQQELAALDSYEQSSESDFDDEEAALAREEAELALLVERMQSTRA
eukprot:TRINITY_DN7303_c0_g1_i2.p1 TRINITY_DN7303_c0_g1~~TRINITY_DN7303_c0_g1_i2.p1  ORF type:complete len:159 (-),score=43.86 TRINITY_DN7303_c0_g1_i2:67-486(-)